VGERRGLRFTAVVLAVLALLTWPFASRYTSFGIDTERDVGDHVRCDFWRVRWPGDGRVGVVHETTVRVPDGRPVDAFDLGGVFWCRDAPPGAGDAMAVAVPHWLLVVVTAALAVVVTRGGKRRAERTVG